MISTSLAELTCLCGAISAPGTLLSHPEIPISLEMCHCNTCRWTTGSLGVAFPPLKVSPSQNILSKLTTYHSSPKVTRYFCSICGCQCFVHDDKHNNWYCLSGIIEPNPLTKASKTFWPKDTIQISRHDYVLDTIDGGLIPFLLNLNGRVVPTWAAAAKEELPHHGSYDLSHAEILCLSRKSINILPRPNDDTFLRAECHCGGVSLLVKRANYASNSDPETSARYIPSDSTKYLTYLCACRSCRLSTGVSLVPWTLIPPGNIFNANDPTTIGKLNSASMTFGYASSNIDANSGLSLKHHWSSPDVCRSFCGKCGATMLYWNAQRPDEVDLAVGILRSEEGSMGRRWLDWEWGRCSSAAESIDEELCKAWLGSATVMNSIGG